MAERQRQRRPIDRSTLFLRYRHYFSGTDTLLSESSTPNSCAGIGLVGPCQCTMLPRLIDDVQWVPCLCT